MQEREREKEREKVRGRKRSDKEYKEMKSNDRKTHGERVCLRSRERMRERERKESQVSQTMFTVLLRTLIQWMMRFRRVCVCVWVWVSVSVCA